MSYGINLTTHAFTAGTGTWSCSAGTINATGSGTIALTELQIGSVIKAAGQTLAVASITNDTHIVFQVGVGAALSGATFTYNNLDAVASLSVDSVDPLGDYYPWMNTVITGDGLERALGRPHTSWLFKNITVAQRAALKLLCPGKSVRVYINTLIDPNTSTFKTFEAAMLWPDTDNTYTPDFTIQFRDLVLL